MWCAHSSGLDVTVCPRVPSLPESAGEALGAGRGILQLQTGLFLWTCVVSRAHLEFLQLLAECDPAPPISFGLEVV